MDSELLKLIVGLAASILGTVGGVILTLVKTRRDIARAEAKQKQTTENIIAKSLEGYQKQVDQQWEQINKVQKRADETDLKYTEVSASNIELTQKNGQLKDRLETLEKEFNDKLDSKNAELSGAQTEILALLANLEKRVRENADLRVQVDKLKDEVARLERFRTELTELRSQVVSLNGQLMTLNTERHALLDAQNDERKRWQEREQELKDHNEKLEAKVNELIRTVNELRAENASLKAEIATWSPATPVQLPAGTLMFEDVKNAAGETVIKAEIIPASGEHKTDSLADKEKPK